MTHEVTTAQKLNFLEDIRLEAVHMEKDTQNTTLRNVYIRRQTITRSMAADYEHLPASYNHGCDCGNRPPTLVEDDFTEFPKEMDNWRRFRVEYGFKYACHDGIVYLPPGSNPQDLEDFLRTEWDAQFMSREQAILQRKSAIIVKGVADLEALLQLHKRTSTEAGGQGGNDA